MGLAVASLGGMAIIGLMHPEEGKPIDLRMQQAMHLLLVFWCVGSVVGLPVSASAPAPAVLFLSPGASSAPSPITPRRLLFVGKSTLGFIRQLKNETAAAREAAAAAAAEARAASGTPGESGKRRRRAVRA